MGPCYNFNNNLSKHLQASFFPFTISNKFFVNLSKNIFKYIFFILPFILIFKSIYTCWHNDIWSFIFFSQHIISNIPFFGQMLIENLWGNNLILSLDSIKDNQDIIQLIFTGGLGSCLGKSIFEIGFFNFSKLPATMCNDAGEIKRPSIKAPLNISLMTTRGPDSASGSSSVPSGSSKVPKEVLEKDPDSDSDSNASKVSGESKAESDRLIGLLPDKFIDEFKTRFLATNNKNISVLKTLNKDRHLLGLKVLEENKECGVTDADLAKEFFKLLQIQTHMYTASVNHRDNFLNYFSNFLSKEDQIQIKEMTLIKERIYNEYSVKLMELGTRYTVVDKHYLKEFFDLINIYREGVNKELLNMEKILQKGINKSNIYHQVPEFNKIVNSDYPQANKTFNEQDGYLKKRIAEVLNESKK